MRSSWSDRFDYIKLIGLNWSIWSDQVDWIKLILTKYSEPNWTNKVDGIIFNKSSWPSWSEQVSHAKLIRQDLKNQVDYMKMIRSKWSISSIWFPIYWSGQIDLIRSSWSIHVD